MKIVIDIPDEVYSYITQECTVLDDGYDSPINHMVHGILHGVILPKGHGRLIDADALEINPEDFGALAVCAIRYCRGRQTYMPNLIRDIIKPHLSEISDKDLQVMINDCGDKFVSALTGGEKPYIEDGWKNWKDELLAEQAKRNNG